MSHRVEPWEDIVLSTGLAYALTYLLQMLLMLFTLVTLIHATMFTFHARGTYSHIC